MKKLRFFLSFIISVFLLATLQTQVYAAEKVNIAEGHDKLVEMVKETFPEYKNRFENPQIKQSNYNMRAVNDDNKKVVFKETRKVDENRQCTLVNYDDGTSLYSIYGYTKRWYNVSSSTGTGYHTYSGDLAIGCNRSPYSMQISNFKYTLVQHAYDKIDGFGSCFVTAPSGGSSSPIKNKIANETSGRPAQASYSGLLIGSVEYMDISIVVDIYVGNDSCLVYCNGERL